MIVLYLSLLTIASFAAGFCFVLFLNRIMASSRLFDYQQRRIKSKLRRHKIDLECQALDKAAFRWIAITIIFVLISSVLLGNIFREFSVLFSTLKTYN